MPDVYTYTDYRKFLRDWFEARKGRPSIRGFAKKVGSSPAQLSSVLAGSRDLAGPLAEAIAGALGLDEPGRTFFLDLVHFEQAETRVQRHETLERIMAIRRFRQCKRIEDTMYLIFSRWYYPAIVELARCRGFRADPDWIAATLVPAVPRAEVVEALEVLQQGGFLVAGPDGRLVPDQPGYATTHDVGRVAGPALANLHRWMLARGRDALADFHKDERHFGTFTFAAPDSALPELKRFITRFEEEAFGRFTDHAGPTRVFQMSIQLFPLSKPTK